jgi:hypothetical protein
MLLISYVKTTTNKRYPYLRVAMIQIDVHPAGENPTNMSHALHAQSAYVHRPYVTYVVHILQHFAYPSIDLRRSTAPEKKGSRYNPQHDD